MKFEEMEGKVAIHCVSEAQLRFLAEKLNENWLMGKITPIWVFTNGAWTNWIREICPNGKIGKYALEQGYKCIECSDLMKEEVEISAEEVVPILTDICTAFNDKENCEGCPMNGLEHVANGNECLFTFKDYGKVIEACKEWKASHMKKRYKVRYVTYEEYEVEAENEEEARNKGDREYYSNHSNHAWDSREITRIR